LEPSVDSEIVFVVEFVIELVVKFAVEIVVVIEDVVFEFIAGEGVVVIVVIELVEDVVLFVLVLGVTRFFVEETAGGADHRPALGTTAILGLDGTLAHLDVAIGANS